MARNLRVGVQRFAPKYWRGLGTRDIFTLSPASFDFSRTNSLDSRITFYRSSIGTFVDASGSIQTASAVEARFDHDPTTGKSLGLLVEEARTNLLLNSATLSTQSVTVGATAHTLSFYGTGTLTLSGVSTDGPLVGTGANQRVSLTFTPTAGSLTLTVSGSVTNAQLEAGSFLTSYIPTTSSQVTREADLVEVSGDSFTSFFNTDASTVFVEGNLLAGSSGQYAFFAIKKSNSNFAFNISRRSGGGSRFNRFDGSAGQEIDIEGPAWGDNSFRKLACAMGQTSAGFADSGSLIGNTTTYTNRCHRWSYKTCARHRSAGWFSGI